MRVTAAIEDRGPIADAPSALPDEQRTVDDPLPIVRSTLIDHGVSHSLLDTLVETAHHTETEAVCAGPDAVLAAALERHYRFDPIGTGKGPQTLLLIGAPGAGKTVTAAKLAARAHLAGDSVRLVTADVLKAGGVAQLEALCQAMKLGMRKVEEPDELAAVVAGAAGGDLVVVDSYGANPFDSNDLQSLGRLIAAARLEPVLVQAAGGDEIDTREAVAAFASIGCRRAIVTRVDLSRRLGSTLVAMADCGLAFAEASATPMIGDGLIELTPAALAGLLISANGTRTTSNP
ncbi:MAG: hypothetical protein ACE5Q3_11870, partial [Alphaproteobacteria bacterium]